MKCSTNLLQLSFKKQQTKLVPRLLLRKKRNMGTTHQVTTSMPSVTQTGTTVPDSVMGAGLVMGPGKYAQCQNNIRLLTSGATKREDRASQALSLKGF